MKSRLSALIGAAILTGALAAGCTSDDSGDAGESTTTTSTSTAPEHEGMGVAVKGHGVTLTVNAAYETDKIELNPSGWKAGSRPTETTTARDGGKFVVVQTEVTNDGRTDMDLTCGFAVQAELQTDPAATYKPIDSLYLVPGNPECNDQLGAGFDTTMTWVFEIPKNREAVTFGFTDPEIAYDDLTFIRLDKLGEKPSTSAKDPEPTDAPGAAAVEPEADAYTPEVVPEAQPDPEVEQYDPDPVIGFTGAPSVDSPHVLDKEVSSCGDPSIHEPGTTFFTDGTSGWTSTCAAQMG